MGQQLQRGKLMPLEDRSNHGISLTSVNDPGDWRKQLPKPYPDPVAYQETQRQALASDPRKKANYERYLESSLSVQVDHLPIKLDAENVSRCNFRCTMCQVSDWGPSYQRAEDMSVEDFKNLIDEQYGLLEIKLQGMGEPLLGRDDYFEMIRYARSKHLWVRTVTNASLLHYRDNYKKLIDTDVNEVQISIDGATKETFEKIRVGSKFELVVANCKLINDYCNDLGLLRTRMWAVIQQGNIDDFLKFVELAHQMRFKRLTLSLSLGDWGQVKWSEINGLATVTEKLTPELTAEAIEIGLRLGVEVTFWDGTQKYSTHSRETLCRWPFERAYVSSDMRIVPCCIIANPEVSDLGDAHNFTKSWNSEDYHEFRRAHLEGRIPEVCGTCYLQPEGKGGR